MRNQVKISIMKNVYQILLDIYEIDKETGNFRIPVRFKDQQDLYNPIDPSPAPVRDLSEELANYLDQCSDEIPLDKTIQIEIEFTTGDRDENYEKECESSIRTYYTHEMYVKISELNSQKRLSLKHLVVSIGCLSAYLISENFESTFILYTLLQEAVLIGGWVFMWEAVTHYFIQNQPTRLEIGKKKRLVECTILFKYQRA